VAQELDEVIGVGRGESLVAQSGVEGLDLLSCYLVQLLAAERLLQSQLVALQVLLPCPLVDLGVGQVVRLEKLIEREHSPLGLQVSPRIGAQGDLGLF